MQKAIHPTFASTQTNIVDRMNSLQHNTTNTTVGFSAKRSGEADFFYPFAAKLQTEKII